MAKLLVEENFQDVQMLVESTAAGAKKYKIKGVFAQAETLNKNKRKYPKAVLEREINRFNNIYVSKKRALGELGHPDTPTINLDKVSHLITSLTEDGNNFIGVAEIIDTPSGKIVQNLLDAGVQLGVSTRGVGSLSAANGYQMVGEDFYLATIDIVGDPSAPDAFVTALREQSKWINESGVWSQKTMDKYRKALNEASKADYERIQLLALARFLSNI